MEDLVIGFLSAVVFSVILFLFRLIISLFQSKKKDEDEDKTNTHI